MFISQARLDTDAVAQAAKMADTVVKEFQSGTARCYTQRTRIYTNVFLNIPLRPGTVLARPRNVIGAVQNTDLICAISTLRSAIHVHDKQGHIAKVYQSKKFQEVIVIYKLNIKL